MTCFKCKIELISFSEELKTYGIILRKYTAVIATSGGEKIAHSSCTTKMRNV